MDRADNGREFLRHTPATLAYRGGNALRRVPRACGAFRGRVSAEQSAPRREFH